MKESIAEAVHESIKDLHKIGLIDLQTMRKFDRLCLPAAHKLKPKRKFKSK